MNDNYLVDFSLDPQGTKPYTFRENELVAFSAVTVGTQTYNLKTQHLIDVKISRHEFGGTGYVSGIFPGVVTVDGSPASRPIELRERDNHRRLVAKTWSDPGNGTYRFNNVDPYTKFDIVARDEPNYVFNDVIVGGVWPWTDHEVIAHGFNLPFSLGNPFTRVYELTGGTLPYLISATSQIPSGANVTLNGKSLQIELVSATTEDLNLVVEDASGNIKVFFVNGQIASTITRFIGWAIEFDNVGIQRLRSDTITHGGTTSSTYTVESPRILRFDMEVSSEANYDYLTLFINSVQIVALSGTQTSSHTTSFAVGDTIELKYSKDGSVNAGTDGGLVYITDL